MQNDTKQNSQILPLLLISLSYTGVAIFLFSRYGVNVVNDSHRYLEYAQGLNNGFYFDPHNFWYIGYAVFIYICSFFSDDLLFIILIQYLLSFVSTYCVYKTGLHLFQSVKAALVASLAYIFFIEILTWNSYILPEGIYASFIAISIYFLIKPKKNYIWTVITSIIVITTCLIKPTGIALLAALLVIGIDRLNKVIPNSYLKTGIYAILTVLMMVLINRMLHTFILIENYTTGEIVYGVSNWPRDNENVKLLTVEVPDNLHLPEQNQEPLVRLALFSFHNPLFTIKLAFSKATLFLLHLRPYWSVIHNLFIIIFLYPFYYFMLRQLKDSTLDRQVQIFVIAFLTGHTLIIALTSVDWDGRFLLPLLPVIFISGSKKVLEFIEALLKIRTKKPVKLPPGL